MGYGDVYIVIDSQRRALQWYLVDSLLVPACSLLVYTGNLLVAYWYPASILLVSASRSLVPSRYSTGSHLVAYLCPAGAYWLAYWYPASSQPVPSG